VVSVPVAAFALIVLEIAVVAVIVMFLVEAA
jgi:hypothetical protein